MEKKHLAIIIALLSLGFGAYIYFFPPVQPGPTQNPTPVPNPIVVNDTLLPSGLSLPFHNDATVCTDCYNKEDETVGQPIDHFYKVLLNYRLNVWDQINSNTIFGAPSTGLNYSTLNNKTSGSTNYDKTDARCIWFSLETIKQFICTIEKNNAKLSNPASNLGIRMYYAVYENNYDFVEKRNRHTLFMVPTCRNGSGEEMDFDPRETFRRDSIGENPDKQMVDFAQLLRQGKSGSTQKYLILAEKEPQVQKRSTYIPPNTEPSLAKNNGEICPTKCPTINSLSEIDQ